MSYSEKDIQTLSELHHTYLKKMQQSNLEEQFVRLKGLTTLEMSVLSILSRNPDISMKDIVDKLQIPKSTMTSVVDRLEKRVFIFRVISKRDRRSFALELTEEGKLAQEEHIKLERLFYSQVLNGLESEDEIQTFFRLIDKIIKSL